MAHFWSTPISIVAEIAASAAIAHACTTWQAVALDQLHVQREENITTEPSTAIVTEINSCVNPLTVTRQLQGHKPQATAHK
jgi:hypothetical protein